MGIVRRMGRKLEESSGVFKGPKQPGLGSLDYSQERKTYSNHSLDVADVSDSPREQFAKWFDEAIEAIPEEANAMTLATASAGGMPSARIVLLKDFDERGFVFYTNYNSRKGRELLENAYAALVFWWQPLERQVRVEGLVEKLPAEESDAYFLTRPRGSQLGAWASPQSGEISNREELEERLSKYATQFEDAPMKRPSHWGGYVVKPSRIEFWQGRPDRVHDRVVYQRDESGWRVVRLAP